MLTIKDPIKLKNNPNLVSGYNNFNERITGNYEMLNVHLAPEDFLHLVTEPPEVYLAEEGMTGVVNDINLYKSQNVKLDVINNVINRILLTEKNELTYQDKTFITSVLYKIGITDVATFMKQVEQVKNDNYNLQKLIKIYNSHSEEISKITENVNEDSKNEVNNLNNNTEETKLFLHQNIFNRLGEKKVLEEVKQFTSSYFANSDNININAINLGEQTYMMSKMILNDLQNNSYITNEPLVYQKINSYEFLDEEQTEVTEENISGQLVSATLLNTIDRIYSVKAAENITKNEIWHPIVNMIYETAENTFNRFEQNHKDARFNVNEVRKINQNIQNNNVRELQELSQFFEHRNTENISSEENVRFSENHNITNNASLNEYSKNHTSYSNNTELTFNTINNETENIDISNTETEEEILQRIEKNEAKNTENIKKFQNAISNVVINKNEPHIDARRLQRDALKAITNPDEVIMEYNMQEEHNTTLINEEVMNALPEDSKRILEVLKEYRENPRKLIESGIVSTHPELEIMSRVSYNNSHETEILENYEEKNRSVIEKVTSDTIEKINRTEEPRIKVMDENHHTDNVEFVHKQTEQTLDEETLQEIINENRVVKRKEIEHTNTIETEHVHEKEVKEIHTENVVNNAGQIENMINAGLTSQIGNISDQVYQRLERRLNNERMRRGRS